MSENLTHQDALIRARAVFGKKEEYRIPAHVKSEEEGFLLFEAVRDDLRWDPDLNGTERRLREEHRASARALQSWTELHKQIRAGLRKENAVAHVELDTALHLAWTWPFMPGVVKGKGRVYVGTTQKDALAICAQRRGTLLEQTSMRAFELDVVRIVREEREEGKLSPAARRRLEETRAVHRYWQYLATGAKPPVARQRVLDEMPDPPTDRTLRKWITKHPNASVRAGSTTHTQETP